MIDPRADDAVTTIVGVHAMAPLDSVGDTTLTAVSH